MSKSLWRTVGIALGAVVIVAVGLVAGKMLFMQSTADNVNNKVVIEENTQDWSAQNVDMKSDDTGIQIPGYGDLYIPANSKDVEITLYNPEKNSCYFKFDLYVDGNSQPVCSTNYIEPGKAVEKLTFDKGVSIGDHTLKMIITTYDMNSEKKLNGAEIKTNLFAI